MHYPTINFLKSIPVLLLWICLCAEKTFCQENAFSISDSLPASQIKSKDNKFKLACSIFVSLQDPNRDWWFKVPPNSLPHIGETRKLFLGQKFSIFPFVSNAELTGEHFSVIYSIIITRPDGQKSALIENSLFRGKKEGVDVILACPDVVSGVLDANFPVGKYKLQMTVYDEVSKQTATAENYFDVVEWSNPVPFVGEELVDGFIKSFYFQPTPEILYSIFTSKDLNMEQKDAPNGLNYIYIGFLRSAFKNNMFILPKIMDQFPTASNLDRAKLIMLFAILGEPPIEEEKLREYEVKYQESMRKHFPLDAYADWDPVMGAAQMDMLWGEFFATGTYAPVRQIMSALSLTNELEVMERIAAQKRKPLDKDEWRSFMLGILNRAALSTIARNAFDFDLVRKYCEWAAENDEISRAAKTKVSPIVKEINEIEKKAVEAEKKALEKASQKKK